MVQLTGQGREAAMRPLAPYATPEDILRDALPMYDPPSRISVTEASERYIRIPMAGRVQGYDRDLVPYMVEPQDVTQSRRYKAVCFIGPAQTGKTQLLMNVALHAVTCDPSPVMIVHMTQSDARAWVEDKLDPVIQNSAAIRERLGRGKDDDAKGRKRFAGMSIEIGWPTVRQLSSRSKRMVLLTDYDHFENLVLGPADNAEGTPFGMALDRITTYRSRGSVLVESTPARPIVDPTWARSQARPHEYPPVAEGIVPIYNDGTRARLYWECRDCHTEFEASFDHIEFDETLDPMTAGERAVMVCPHCGAVIDHRHKVELNRAILKGRGGWRHEASDGTLCALGDVAIRGTDIASYAMDGAAAAFRSWSDLVAQKITATRRLEELGDETDLRKFYYTGLGRPYLPIAVGDDGAIPLAELREGRTLTPRGHCPDWTAFVVTAVDVQRGRFVVAVHAFGLDGRRTVVDRFDLATPPEGAPGDARRALDPAKAAEDWAVLDPLAIAEYPVEGQGVRLRPAALGVDFQGEPGVSDNAEKFWGARRKAGQGNLWFVTRGHGGLHQRSRTWHEAPERGNARRRRGIRILNIATDRLKDTVASALLKPGTAEGAFPLPEWLEDDPLVEFTAETRTEKGWVPRPGMKRNESLDLAVQAQALAEHKGLRRINAEAPPAWAAMSADNPFRLADAGEIPKPAAPVLADDRATGWITKRTDWI